MNRRHPALIACLAIGLAAEVLAQNSTVISGATVIGGAGAPVRDAVIVIEAGRITRVGPRASTVTPPNATVIEATGKFVTPGLADMHNHLLSGSFRTSQNIAINQSVLLAFGVTTVFNPSSTIASFKELKASASSDTTPVPRFFGTGPIVTTPGDMLGAQVGSPTPASADEARTIVRDLKAAGVDAIKVNRDDISWASKRQLPLMKKEVLEALVDEAHLQGLKVYAHAPLLEQAKEVLRAGGDGLLHGIVDTPIDQELIDLMLRNRAVYVPTMALYEDVGDVGGWARRLTAAASGSPLSSLAESFTAPDFAQRFEAFFDNTTFTKSRLDTQRRNLKKAFDAKIPVVMGTDSGFYGVMMGTSSHVELALMVEAGLTPEDALRAATLNAARMLGQENQLGSVEAGKLADLLILDANPLEDIRNISRIHRVLKGGAVYDPVQLLSTVKFSAPTRAPAK